MKTAKEHFDRKYEVRRNFYNESAIPLDQRGFIFECMESYAKETAIEFALSRMPLVAEDLAQQIIKGVEDNFDKFIDEWSIQAGKKIPLRVINKEEVK